MVLFTIGYEGRTLEEVVSLLHAHGVKEVIDVRENPHSRRPEFCKSNLGQTLVNAELCYRSFPNLGTPKVLRDSLKNGEDFSVFLERYSTHLDSQIDTLQIVLGTIEKTTCCLLCYEANPNFCHRKRLAECIEALDGGLIKTHHL